MHADLAHLIHLQQLDTAAETARRTIADEPVRHREFDAKIAATQQALDTEKQRLAANQAARRDIEKELSLHQGRLSKYRDQLMAVKTNREYQAMQKEIETAQHEIQAFEERMLERMIEFDEITAEVKKAEARCADEKKAIEAERRQMAIAVAAASESLTAIAAERATVVAQISPASLATFQRVVKGRGTLAVVEVRDGRCTACQVRVRPQVYNELRRSELVFQCESCQRILYFAGSYTAIYAQDEPTPTPNSGQA
jgi:predicted  nucleic acid-binding Zn-ribbon protein